MSLALAQRPRNTIDQLLQDRHGLTVSEDVARHDISDYIDYVAEMMRIGRQAAKMYARIAFCRRPKPQTAAP
jgi:poly-beta-hydroxyalkanoate depolymerase